ncbi:hypothetical protein GCM10022214_83890 [Actinomadura miaoliensis]|uniref:Uncharacterized protein n=1 Tax=Actinomadura miaoliensis TaxID=430685 RepID=A0ABP7X5I1_9ACTN
MVRGRGDRTEGPPPSRDRAGAIGVVGPEEGAGRAPMARWEASVPSEGAGRTPPP